MFRSSKLYQYEHCPGSMALEASLPDAVDDSKYAAEGPTLHTHMFDRTLDRSQLSDEQREVLDVAAGLEDDFVGSVVARHGLSGPPLADIRETEYKMTNVDDDLRRHVLFTGHPDRVMVWPNVVVVSDYKFGYRTVTSAPSNRQLRSYFCQVAEEHVADHYYLCIIQPRAPGDNKFHSVCYTYSMLDEARETIIAAVAASHAPNARRIPSPLACVYCRGLLELACLEARITPDVVAMTMGHEQLARLGDMTPEQRTALMNIVEVARAVVKIRREQAHELLSTDPSAIPGWKLTSSGTTSEYDTMAIFNRVGPSGHNLVTPTQFVAATKVSLPELAKEIAVNMQLKPTPARKLLDERISDLVTKKPKAMSLACETTQE